MAAEITVCAWRRTNELDGQTIDRMLCNCVVHYAAVVFDFDREEFVTCARLLAALGHTTVYYSK